MLFTTHNNIGLKKIYFILEIAAKFKMCLCWFFILTLFFQF